MARSFGGMQVLKILLLLAACVYGYAEVIRPGLDEIRCFNQTVTCEIAHPEAAAPLWRFVQLFTIGFLGFLIFTRRGGAFALPAVLLLWVTAALIDEPTVQAAAVIMVSLLAAIAAAWPYWPPIRGGDVLATLSHFMAFILWVNLAPDLSSMAGLGFVHNMAVWVILPGALMLAPIVYGVRYGRNQ